MGREVRAQFGYRLSRAPQQRRLRVQVSRKVGEEACAQPAAIDARLVCKVDDDSRTPERVGGRPVELIHG